MSENPNTVITRRVRLELPAELPAPFKDALAAKPYDEWLKTHIAEVMSLENDKGEKLVAGIHSRMGQNENGAVFVTDFTFESKEKFDYYNQHKLATMRGRIEESYPGATASGSPFKYTIKAIAAAPSAQERMDFEGLLAGVRSFTDVARVGVLGRS